MPTRVLIVGAGPAGLAAASRLLEKGGGDRYSVRVAVLGHHFGGKADSWRDGEGRLIDHGQHIVAGWYSAMKGLLQRAGVDVDAHLVSNRGHSHMYEPRDGKVHELGLKRNPLHMLFSGLGYSGLTGAEKLNVTKFVLGNLGVFLKLQDIEQFDDICFTAWCLSNGLRPSVVKTNMFQVSRLGQMNWPREISAYSMLKTMRVMGRDYRTSLYYFPDGGMSERFWEPLVAHISKLGGRFDMMRKLLSLQTDGRRLTGATFAEPDSAGHDSPARDPDLPKYEPSVPTKPGTEQIDRDFDHLICAIPPTAFQELNPRDDRLWRIPELAKIRKLRGIASLAMQVWHREGLTRRYDGAVGGLAGPLPFVIDNKHIIRDYRENPRYGAVLYFVGQETGHEECTDEQLLTLCLDNVARVPGYEQIDRAGVIHYRVLRHRSADKLYFLTEPGVQKFRPKTRTPLANLWLAGDWVRTDIDFPCMESAVRSGIAAADAVIGSSR